MTGPPITGVVLAAGAGTRMGLPKALVHDGDGVGWLSRACAVLEEAGCEPVIVVLGARAEEARVLIDGSSVRVVVAADWERGLSASLLAGLAAAGETDASAALITLVDLPDLTASALTRLVDHLGTSPTVLGRAVYSGRPGHPVLLGRDHWSRVVAAASGDSGAGDYLLSAGAALVECGDLGGGDDVDGPAVVA